MTRSLKDLLTFCCLAAFGFAAAFLVATELGHRKWMTPGWGGCDERSYILAANTFLKGRLSNPTPDLWKSFECDQVLVRPAYMSKYPPGYALILVVGKLLGHYLVVSWLAIGLFGGFLYLLLRYLLPYAWAVAVSVWAVFISMERWWWSDSFGWKGEYYGAAAAALLWGTFRYMRKKDAGSCLIIGCSVSVIALCRPVEGLAFCLGLAPMLIALLCRQGLAKSLRHLGLMMLLPVMALVFMFTVNNAVTGKWYLFPHVVYSKTYMPAYRHTIFDEIPINAHTDNAGRDQRLQELINHENKCNWHTFFKGFFKQGAPLTFSWVGLVMLLVFWKRVLRNPYLRTVLVVMVFITIALAIDGVPVPRYFAMWYAPSIALFAWAGIKLVCVLGFRGRRILGALRWILVALAVMPSAVYWCNAYYRHSAATGWGAVAPANEFSLNLGRFVSADELEYRLGKMPGRYLVFLYQKDDPTGVVWYVWVHNGPDLDEAKVVWARSVDKAWDDRVVARYGKDRKVLYLYAPVYGWSMLAPQDLFYMRKPNKK